MGSWLAGGRWLLSLALLLGVCTTTLIAEDCLSLDGKWYNQLGSEIILSHGADGQLKGEYRTAVERQPGAAGTSHSQIIGAAPYNKPGAAFGMAVLWNGGNSTTAWTGQCLVCDDGKETLVTSWLLRSKVDTCVDKWKSTMIGRDFFTREEQEHGPRKAKDTHSPGDLSPYTGEPVFKYRQMEKRDTDNQSIRRCSLNGFWYNQLGSELILEQNQDSTVTGEYRTAVERERGAAGNTHSKVYGISNPSMHGSTWALFVVWKNGESVTGWVGQCHLCGATSAEVMEAAWLLRQQVPHCSDSWKSTLYGESSYTRHEQTLGGPRKRENTHTPGEGGEDPGPLSKQTECSSMATVAWPTKLVLVLSALMGILTFL